MISFNALRVVLFFACSSLFGRCVFGQNPVLPQTLKIEANGYIGGLASPGQKDLTFLHGDTILTLQPGTDGRYALNTGATIGDYSSLLTSYIYLFFDQQGLLDSLCPHISATIGKDRKSIRLNTTPITIDPGQFNREWYPSCGVAKYVRNGYYKGKKTLRLIKGLTYTIDNAHTDLYYKPRIEKDTSSNDTDCVLKREAYYGSYFYVKVLDNGQVQLYNSNFYANSASALACGRTLVFKTVWVTLDPIELSGGKSLQLAKPESKFLNITKRTRLPFIRATVNSVQWPPEATKPNYYHFLPM